MTYLDHTSDTPDVSTRDVWGCAHAREVLPADAPVSQWRSERLNGLGGSEVLAVVGCSQYQTAIEVFWNKTGRSGGQKPNEKMLAGHWLEPVVVARFEDLTGIECRNTGMWRRYNAPWEFANPDRFTADGRGLECKTASGPAAWREWKDGPIDHAIGQAQWYMHVTGRDQWYIAVLLDGWKLKYWLLDRDQQLIDRLVDEAARFWHDNVLADVAPPIGDETSIARTLKQLYGYVYRASSPVEVPGITALADRRIALKEAIAELEKELAATENPIKAAIGDHHIATEHGVPVIEWASRDSRAVRVLKDLRPTVNDPGEHP